MTFFAKLVLTTTLLAASVMTVSAQLPSLEEMRAQLLAAGMTPEQVDEALKGLSEQLPSLGDGAPSAPIGSSSKPAPCEDENENDVCDDEEDESEVTRCGISYLDAITKFALDNYGTRLGEDPVGIALTCQVVASAQLGPPTESNVLSRSFSEKVYRVNAIADYWNAVLRRGGELSPSLRRRYERIERLPAALRRRELSSDLRPIIAITDKLDSSPAHVTEADKARERRLIQQLFNLAVPVNKRCENIRNNVGGFYRSQYPDEAVCLVDVPEDDDESEDMPEDEE